MVSPGSLTSGFFNIVNQKRKKRGKVVMFICLNFLIEPFTPELILMILFETNFSSSVYDKRRFLGHF